ncbi:hypothetical protein PRIPAC_76363, partial [Pristionchus pacificus]
IRMNRSVGLVPSSGPSTSGIGGGGMGGSSLSSLSSAPSGSTSTNIPEGRTHVTKVAEVFLTAGHAFQRLGDLTLQLQGETAESEENKWLDADIAKLRDALTRFAHELDTISDSVQQRTMKHIKVDIKRRTLVGDEASVRRGQSPAVPGMGTMGTMGGGGGGGMGGMGGMSGGPMGVQKRSAHMLPMPSSGMPPAKRMGPTTSYTKFQPYSSGGPTRLAPARPPTTYLTESSVSGPPTLNPLATPLLNDPSHHYLNSRAGSNF